MDKKQFQEIFKKAMTKNYVSYHYEAGTETRPAEPKIVIRDFDCYGLNDREFSDFETAWNYFKQLESYRVMDVEGLILADHYIKRY